MKHILTSAAALLLFALGPVAALASSHPVASHSHAAGTHSHTPRPHTNSSPKPHLG